MAPAHVSLDRFPAHHPAFRLTCGPRRIEEACEIGPEIRAVAPLHAVGPTPGRGALLDAFPNPGRAEPLNADARLADPLQGVSIRVLEALFDERGAHAAVREDLDDAVNPRWRIARNVGTSGAKRAQHCGDRVG